jgi:anti-sigma regulatory factor (Ser/Thr protein kinase)
MRRRRPVLLRPAGSTRRLLVMADDRLVLEATPVAPARARTWVAHRLVELGQRDLRDLAELLTSELVTNALLHAGTAIALTVRPDGSGVRVDVHDGSASGPQLRHHSSLTTVGRGLGMVEQLADSWGWDATDAGKTVWFSVSAPQDDGEDDGQPAGTSGAVEEGTTDAAESGLGRYAPAGGGDGGALVAVRLLRLPVHLLVASQEHHDALIREFRLMSFAGQAPDSPPAPDLPAELAHIVEQLGVRYGRARARRDEEVRQAIEQGLLHIDQTYLVPAGAAEQIRQIGLLLDAADRFCAANLLLTLQRPPLLRRFGHWYRAEIVNQVAGRPPTPWDGPLRLPDPTSADERVRPRR